MTDIAYVPTSKYDSSYKSEVSTPLPAPSINQTVIVRTVYQNVNPNANILVYTIPVGKTFYLSYISFAFAAQAGTYNITDRTDIKFTQIVQDIAREHNHAFPVGIPCKDEVRIVLTGATLATYVCIIGYEQ